MSLHDDHPLYYAKSIAYIGNASTIRARTRDLYGDAAPSLAECERIVRERKRKFEKARELAEKRDALGTPPEEPMFKSITEKTLIQRDATRRYRERQREAARRYRARLREAKNA